MNEINHKNELDLSNYTVVKDSGNNEAEDCFWAYFLPNNLILCYSNNREYWVSYTSILEVFLMSIDKSLVIINKDLKITKIIPKDPSNEKSSYIFELLCGKIKNNNTANYCLECYKASTEEQHGENEYSLNGDTLEHEFDRLKFDKELWEISTINKDYSICSTYSQKLIFPKKVSPSLINHLKEYRDQQRLPILSYFNGKNLLLRCSQPMMGLMNKNSVQDESLIKEYIKTADLNSKSANNKNKLMIIDCRPLKNAMAQQYIMGGGSEQPVNYQYDDIPGNYEITKKMFLNLPNIHIVSSQFQQVLMGYTLKGLKEKGEESFKPLDFGWYETIAQVLENLDYLLKEYLLNSTHFLIHCTHGWDRTSMLTSLLMICSDPFYRTINGFFVLIQLEWLDYGFRFAERFNVKVSKTSTELENMDSMVEEEMEKVEERDEPKDELKDEPKDEPKDQSPSGNNTISSIFQYVKSKKNDFIGDRFDNINLSNVNNLTKKLDIINLTGEGEISKRMSCNISSSNDSWSAMLTSSHSTDPCNDMNSGKHKAKGGKSPVMIQFLDLIWQLIRQQPDKFEYNEKFLLKFLENVVSGKFAEFLNDSDLERKSFFKEHGISPSYYHWSKYFEVKKAYMNLDYKKSYSGHQDDLWIFPDHSQVAIWEGLWKKGN